MWGGEGKKKKKLLAKNVKKKKQNMVNGTLFSILIQYTF